MSKIAVRDFYQGVEYRTWKGHRVNTVDGSTLNLPSRPATRAEFGEIQVGHLEAVNFLPGNLLLCDRGYPSIALMYTLRQRGIHFCFRMKTVSLRPTPSFLYRCGVIVLRQQLV